MPISSIQIIVPILNIAANEKFFASEPSEKFDPIALPYPKKNTLFPGLYHIRKKSKNVQIGPEMSGKRVPKTENG